MTTSRGPSTPGRDGLGAAQSSPYVLPDEALRDAVEGLLLAAKRAEERLPAERVEAARERNRDVRHYREGLIDGTQEAIKNLLHPFARTCLAASENDHQQAGEQRG